MKEHVKMRIQNLGSIVQTLLQNDPVGLGSEQLIQKCDHLSSATSATSEVGSFETDDDGSPISVREVLSASVASCSSNGSGQHSGSSRQNGLPSVPNTSAPTGSSQVNAARSPPASPPRRKARNHLRSYQATYMGRTGSATTGGSNVRQGGLLRSSLQQQRQYGQKDLVPSTSSIAISPAAEVAIAPVPKTMLSRPATAPAPKAPSPLVVTTKLARSSSNPDDQVASIQPDASTRSVRWSSTASVRTIDPTSSQDTTSDTSVLSTLTPSNNSTPGSTEGVASTTGPSLSLHAKQRRTLQEIREEVERIQKARAAQSALAKSSRRSTKTRTILSNLPEEYSVPITDESREGKLAARISGDNASNSSSNEPLTTACESFKSCSSNISQLSTVPFAAMDTAVVSGLRISTTKGISTCSDAISNQTAEKAKKFLQAEREKERKYQRQKEKRNQKKKPSLSPPIKEEGATTERAREGSRRQPHTRTAKKGRKKVSPIIWGDNIVKVLQEELHNENEEKDDATAATSTTTDTAGARTKLRPAEGDAADAKKRKDNMAAATACKSVWSIQSDATRVVDNRTTFTQTHFTRTV